MYSLACQNTPMMFILQSIVDVLVDGETRTLDNLHVKFNTIGENGKAHTGWRANPACSLVRVITNSPTPLPQEWITSYKESFGTLVKKRTYEQLQNGMKSSMAGTKPCSSH